MILSQLIALKTKIRWESWLVKFHYALFWGGAGCSGQFVSLLAGDIGLNATEIGIIGSISFACLIISQPLFGVICDRFKNDKFVMIFTVLISAITLFSLIWIPQVPEYRPINETYKSCQNIRIFENNICVLDSQFELQQSSVCNAIELSKIFENSTSFCSSNDKNNTSSDQQNKQQFLNFTDSKYTLENMNLTACNISEFPCFKLKNINDTHRNLYKLLFSIISVTAQIFTFTGFILSDSICQRILSDNCRSEFGFLKFWSTCSYGIMAFVAGYINDVSNVRKYTVGFFIMLGAYTLDVCVLYCLPKPTTEGERFQLKNVKRIFTSREILIFTAASFFIGTFTALAWNYQFIFLASIGASQTLLGIISLFQYCFADVIFYTASGLIINKIGHIGCMVLSFLAFSARYIILSFVINPWYALFAEFFEGITFALFLVNVITFSTENAPEGLVFTIIGIIVAVFQGIGLSVGSFLTGLSFDNLGKRITYQVASSLSLICAIILCIVILITKRKSKKFVPR